MKPVIGLTADCKLIPPHPYHCVGDKYIRAVLVGARGIPVLLPAMAEHLDLEEVLQNLDGVVLPGGYSNMDPHHYAGPAPDPDSLLDPARDAVDLGVIPLAVEMGIPLLAICRGFQAMNVAFGGSIHQKVHAVPGLMDHREKTGDAVSVQYDLAHTVTVHDGGLLARVAGAGEHRVNSLHGQGVQVPGKGLRVEATAPDGLVEALSVTGSRAFALGVQWHPEWKHVDNRFYAMIWDAFRIACARHLEQRLAMTLSVVPGHSGTKPKESAT